jgi:2-polyprenyl-6-hydroxyphenyl methylase/3-demethylubiquinone-9 3-methyltransferase
VLDVGCGLGEWTNLLAEAGYEAHGLDFSPGLIDAARERAAARGSSATFTVGPAERMPFPDAHFDAVVCNYLLEHARDWRAVIGEIARVVRPGGAAFLSTNCALYPFTDEVRLPLYPYYPSFIKRRVIALALTRYPALVRYSPTPAINWLTPGTLKRAFREAGFGDPRDAFDVVRIDQVRGAKRVLARAVLPVVRRVPPAKTLAYFGYPALKIYAVKDGERNA